MYHLVDENDYRLTLYIDHNNSNVIKKTRAHKAANPQPATEAADAEGAAD
jgi:hypothetical protein